jgi:hypothetical protein
MNPPSVGWVDNAAIRTTPPGAQEASNGYRARALGVRAMQGRGASALLSAETREAAYLPCLAGEQGSELTAPKSYRPTSSRVPRLAACRSVLIARPGCPGFLSVRVSAATVLAKLLRS